MEDNWGKMYLRWELIILSPLLFGGWLAGVYIALYILVHFIQKTQKLLGHNLFLLLTQTLLNLLWLFADFDSLIMGLQKSLFQVLGVQVLVVLWREVWGVDFEVLELQLLQAFLSRLLLLNRGDDFTVHQLQVLQIHTSLHHVLLEIVRLLKSRINSLLFFLLVFLNGNDGEVVVLFVALENVVAELALHGESKENYFEGEQMLSLGGNVPGVVL